MVAENPVTGSNDSGKDDTDFYNRRLTDGHRYWETFEKTICENPASAVKISPFQSSIRTSAAVFEVANYPVKSKL